MITSDTTVTPHKSDSTIRLVLVAAQLGVLVLLVYSFELESRAFFYVLLLACMGFLAGFTIPATARMPFFAGLSILSLFPALGVEAASVVLAVGVLLILLCHLPIAFAGRILLVVGVGAGLAVLRASAPRSAWPPMATPIIASMFMFRLALYLHALRYDKIESRPSAALAYFFMMPNACFPLFPVVDYKTFVQPYDTADRWSTYEEGLRAMFRGVVQLLLFRVVKHELMLTDPQVYDVGDLVQHLLSAYLLYLRVSGQFHLIVGMLHLFGFRLPETHFRYFLARNFSDLWRRINIYWKDFMLKLVFYPSFFRFRHRGQGTAMILSTVVVFAATWFLHSYQQFWLQGVPRLDWRDTLFWAVFATLVVMGNLRQGFTGADRTLVARNAWSLRRAVSILATFTIVSLLWSFWTAQSFDTWVYMFTQARYIGPHDLFTIIGVLCGGLVVAASPWAAQPITARLGVRSPLGRTTQHALVRIGGSLLFCMLVVPNIAALFAPYATRLTRTLRDRGVPYEVLGARGVGYYDEVQAPPPDMPENTWHPVPKPRVWNNSAFGYRRRDDFMMDEATPSLRNVVAGHRISINQWGMRDREYQLAKAPDTFRIAFIGNSIGMGWGVGDADTYEALIESVLDSLARQHGRRIETLNLSSLGPTMTKEVFAMSTWAKPFSPDLIVLSANTNEIDEIANIILVAAQRNIPIPDSTLAALAAATLAVSDSSPRSLALRLRRIEDRWHRRVLEWAKQSADSLHARLAVLNIKAPGVRDLSPTSPLGRAIRDSNLPVLNCSNSYAGLDPGTLWLSPSDQHPTAIGHDRLSRCILHELRIHPSLLPDFLRRIDIGHRRLPELKATTP